MMVRKFTFIPKARHSALIAGMSAIVLSLAGCGGFRLWTWPTEPPPPLPETTVAGEVTSIKGSTVTVSAKESFTNVLITPETLVVQIRHAELVDITTDSCVNVIQVGGAPARARVITVGAPLHSECPQSNDGRQMRGAVTSVDGQTVSVADSSDTSATVEVDKKTKYWKQSRQSALVITKGVCLTVVGIQKDSVLEASRATVEPTANGKCP